MQFVAHIADKFDLLVESLENIEDLRRLRVDEIEGVVELGARFAQQLQDPDDVLDDRFVGAIDFHQARHRRTDALDRGAALAQGFYVGELAGKLIDLVHYLLLVVAPDPQALGNLADGILDALLDRRIRGQLLELTEVAAYHCFAAEPRADLQCQPRLRDQPMPGFDRPRCAAIEEFARDRVIGPDLLDKTEARFDEVEQSAIRRFGRNVELAAQARQRQRRLELAKHYV